jgi:hypothetical protein
MPSIEYGGVDYVQVRHAVFCKLCKDTIESTHVHDFKFCTCGAVGIDGGIMPGNRILGNLSDMETRSMYCATVGTVKMWLPQKVIEDWFTAAARPSNAYSAAYRNS